jgi:hypothetical protein
VDFDAQMRRVLQRLPDVLIEELGEERAVELAEKEPERLEALVSDVVKEALTESGHDLAVVERST